MEFRVHLTNVTGLGASQLAQSLLPALERVPGHKLTNIYLPQHGPLADYRPTNALIKTEQYRRYIPNSISRILECTLLSHRFDGNSPLLVLGDLPLNTSSKQTVFVQSAYLINNSNSNHKPLFAIVSQLLFRMSTSKIEHVIVQSLVMRNGLLKTYPQLPDKVEIIPQPVPNWLIASDISRTKRMSNGGLRLFYPAAEYPHKNHRLLSHVKGSDAHLWDVDQLILTIEESANPNRSLPWVSCSGRLPPEKIVDAYTKVDALLFLSTLESYGFPLVEAMYVGLPIVCPDLPYARNLCGAEAIYFDPNNISSLRQALSHLKQRLDNGWWPNWSKSLVSMPKSWDDVASQMIATMTAV